jgi:hypothetical protein
MEATGSSDTGLPYETTWHHIQEGNKCYVFPLWWIKIREFFIPIAFYFLTSFSHCMNKVICQYHYVCVCMCTFSYPGSTNPGYYFAGASKIYTVEHNIFVSTVWNLLHIACLVPRILMWLLDCWKICELLFLISQTGPGFNAAFCVISTGSLSYD